MEFFKIIISKNNIFVPFQWYTFYFFYLPYFTNTSNSIFLIEVVIVGIIVASPREPVINILLLNMTFEI